MPLAGGDGESRGSGAGRPTGDGADPDDAESEHAGLSAPVEDGSGFRAAVLSGGGCAGDGRALARDRAGLHMRWG